MSEKVLTNAHVTLDGNDLSDHVRSVTINYSSEVQDVTAMSNTSRVRLGGLKDFSVDIEFNQDWAASNLDSILFPLVGSSIAIEIRSDAGAVSTSNPKYTGNVILESYQPLGNTVGEAATTTVTLQGNGDLSRATA